MSNAARIAKALGGIRDRKGFLCHCPVRSHGKGRGDKSRSLSIKDGNKVSLIVKCFAGCDPLDILDELRKRGLVERDENAASSEREFHSAKRVDDDEDRSAYPLRLWRQAGPIKNTPAWLHLQKRGIDLDELPSTDALRWHAHCPWEDGRHGCMLALLTDALSAEPKAIHRTAITSSGEKIGRKYLGPSSGCVIRLWPDDAVTLGLVIGEGIETTLAAATRIRYRGTLLQPAWAAGDAGNLAKFPVLPGIEALTILVDHDDGKGAGQQAALECSKRWTDAGREVVRLVPNIAGTDFNDLVTRATE